MFWSVPNICFWAILQIILGTTSGLRSRTFSVIILCTVSDVILGTCSNFCLGAISDIILGTGSYICLGAISHDVILGSSSRSFSDVILGNTSGVILRNTIDVILRNTNDVTLWYFSDVIFRNTYDVILGNLIDVIFVGWPVTWCTSWPSGPCSWGGEWPIVIITPWRFPKNTREIIKKMSCNFWKWYNNIKSKGLN